MFIRFTLTFLALALCLSVLHAITIITEDFPGTKQRLNVIINNSPTTASYGSTYSISTSATSGEAVTFSSSDQSVLTDAGVTVSSGNTTITLSAAGDDEYAAATDVTFLLTVTNDIPVFTFQASSTSVEVGDTVTFTGSISDSDFTELTWTIYAVGGTTGTGAVISHEITFTDDGVKNVDILVSDGDQEISQTNSNIEITVTASDPIIDTTAAFTGVESTVSSLDNGVSETEGSTTLSTLLLTTSGVELTESIKAFSATLSANTEKTFTSGNLEVLAKNFAVQADVNVGSVNIQSIPAGNTIVIGAGVDDEEFTSLPTGIVGGSIFTADLFDSAGGEVTTGFSFTTILEGVVTGTGDYKLYTADENGSFSDSGFTTTVVNGTDLSVTMTHFSTFAVVEETTTSSSSSSGGGGGCLLR